MTTLTDNRGTYRDPRDAAPEIPSVVKQSLITADRFSWWDCVRVALLIIGIIIVIGCAGSAATFKGEKTIVYPDGSTFTQTTAHAAKTIDPSNAAEPGGVDINADGITTKTAATWEQKFTDISRGKVTFAYAWFSLGLFIAAAFATWKFGWVAGALLAGAGFIFLLADEIKEATGNALAQILPPVFLIAILGGGAAVYFWFKKRGERASAKLMVEGKPMEAMAAQRVSNPSMDAEFVKQKKAEKKAKVEKEKPVIATILAPGETLTAAKPTPARPAKKTKARKRK